MHTELSTPLLMITSPNDMVTYDKHDHDHDLDPQQQQSVTKDNQKNQLTVNKQRLYCINPSMNYFNNNNNNNNNRRYSDQGSRLSNQQSNLSTIYKRQSLFNINANHHHHHHLNYPNQSNQQHQYHNHDLYKTRLYPPTRLKNSSTSNVDLLAEAILKMQGTLNFPDNDSIHKSRIDSRRSTLSSISSTCFPLNFRHLKRKSCFDENIQFNELKNDNQEDYNCTTGYPTLDQTSSLQKINQPMNNKDDNDDDDADAAAAAAAPPADDDDDKLTYRNQTNSMLIPTCIVNYDSDEKICTNHQINQKPSLKYHSTNLELPNHQYNESIPPLGNHPDSMNIISLHVPKLPQINKSLSSECELSLRIRRVSMILQQNRQDMITTHSSNQYNDSNEVVIPKLNSSGSSTIHLKKNNSNDMLEHTNPIHDDNDDDDGSPMLKKSKPSIELIQSNDYLDPLKQTLNHETNNLLNKNSLFSNKFKKERRLTDKLSKGIGYHLGRRRRLLESRRRMADFALAFSIFEYTKDWRICVTKHRVIQIITELLICSIHPFPGIDLFFNHSFPITNYVNYKRNHSLHHLSDHFSPYLLLILPMLGRLYLALRALLLHSRMFNDAGSRSIGAFNKGSACTALLVAVFSKKLEMTKAEKHVLHFMESSKLTKKVKHCAANVLRETWLLYKHAKLMPTFNSHRVRAHQRKFLQAIYRLRTMKVKQRELQDKSNSLVDLAKLQTNVYERVADISLRQEDFQNQLTTIEDMLRSIQRMTGLSFPRRQLIGLPSH
uniref:Small conductance calcium-activated potassium channel protein n=1 Tax=Schistosoma haematobium TaxID=6185 RepID=A0A094ZGE0_SCHHA